MKSFNEGEAVPARDQDEFAVRVQELIGRRDQERAQILLDLRVELQYEDDRAPDDESLEENDERVNRFLAAARSLVGDELYVQLFEMEPGHLISFPDATAAE
jgi:hypothetical protein